MRQDVKTVGDVYSFKPKYCKYFFSRGWDTEKLFSTQNLYTSFLTFNRFSIHTKYYVTV